MHASKVSKWRIYIYIYFSRSKFSGSSVYIYIYSKYVSQWQELWSRIINDDTNALNNLLPCKLNRPLRQRGHDFELPFVKTEGFKNTSINRCLFNFI